MAMFAELLFLAREQLTEEEFSWLVASALELVSKESRRLMAGEVAAMERWL